MRMWHVVVRACPCACGTRCAWEQRRVGLGSAYLWAGAQDFDRVREDKAACAQSATREGEGVCVSMQVVKAAQQQSAIRVTAWLLLPAQGASIGKRLQMQTFEWYVCVTPLS